jgi:hypothetical protein
MTIAFNEMHTVHLGYAAIFVCLCFGFLILKFVYKNEISPWLWAISSLCNSIGFLLWSGILSIEPYYYYLTGEIFHILGIFLFVYGALKFANVQNIKKWGIPFVLLWILIWICSILLISKDPIIAGVSLKLLRAILFVIGGMILLVKKDDNEPVGKNLAGASLVIWSLYIGVSIFIHINGNLFFGFLIGFHVLSAFGMVSMITDKIRVESERREKQVKKLEGILPICSYCKKIRDEKNNWRILEEYIEDRSKAQFSHGICPECFKKYRPDR